jgi:hypothetical protein
MKHIKGDLINLSVGWTLIVLSYITETVLLDLVACGIFIGGIIKVIFDKS